MTESVQQVVFALVKRYEMGQVGRVDLGKAARHVVAVEYPGYGLYKTSQANEG